MTTLTVLFALALALVFIAAATTTPAISRSAQKPTLATRIAEQQTSVWNCQDKIGQPRTPVSVPPWQLPRSAAYRRFVLNLWTTRRTACLSALHARANVIRRWRTIPNTGDWQTAVALAQRIYPGTRTWLLACSSGEGGHGNFVMNHQGSGAGGWMQFLSSTFTANSPQAFADARARGFTLPAGAESWYHPLGQAITAAYLRTHGGTGHWDARECHSVRLGLR